MAALVDILVSYNSVSVFVQLLFWSYICPQQSWLIVCSGMSDHWKVWSSQVTTKTVVPASVTDKNVCVMNNNNNSNNNNNDDKCSRLSAVILFEASMEFLENTNADDDDDIDDDEDTSSFVTAPLLPAFPPVAVETLPMRYNHAHRDEQAVAVGMGGRATAARRFDSALEDYYTLRLRGTFYIEFIF